MPLSAAYVSRGVRRAWPGFTNATGAAVSTCWEPGSNHSHCLLWTWKEASWKVNPWQQARPGELVSLQITSASAVGGHEVWVGYPALKNCLLFSSTFPLLSSFTPTTFWNLFFIQGLFFLVYCSYLRTSGKGHQMEKRVICFFSSSVFACVYVFPLTSANSVKMGGWKNK